MDRMDGGAPFLVKCQSDKKAKAAGATFHLCLAFFRYSFVPDTISKKSLRELNSFSASHHRRSSNSLVICWCFQISSESRQDVQIQMTRALPDNRNFPWDSIVSWEVTDAFHTFFFSWKKVLSNFQGSRQNRSRFNEVGIVQEQIIGFLFLLKQMCLMEIQ